MAVRKLTDDYIHLGHRRRLISVLRARGIQHEATLQAIASVPRHYFVGVAYEHLAYEDRALPIACGQTISQPYTVAYQTSLLKAEPRQKVLEIGTGSGYQAAVLGTLGLRVFTLERQETLFNTSRELLASGRFGKVRSFLRDGYKGLPVYGPYERILVTAGAAQVPRVLLDQLAPGGIMVVPVGETAQTMQRITRIGPEQFEVEDLGAFRFVPFVQGLTKTTAAPPRQPRRLRNS